MASQTVTDVDFGSIVLETGEYEDGVINFGGADTLVAGTIIARHTGTLKFQIYTKGGSSNGNGVPVGVLTHAVVATGSGDVACRPLIAGKVNKNRLVIDADGDGSNVDATVTDLLKDSKITAVDVRQVGGALFTDEDS